MIRLDQRLRCAFHMLRGADTVADIGCDHGKLTAALLLEGGCRRVIAGDVSPDCLNKAAGIIQRYGLQGKAQVRLGSGFTILAPGECDAAAVLGMGGELMVELMEASPRVVEELDRLVLQPMSGVEELRRWLYENEFHVREDRLVPMGSRWYQVLSVKKAGEADPWPEGFPRDCYMVGYRTFSERDRLLAPYCREQLKKRREQLCRAAGTAGEDRLAREVGQLEGIIREAEAWS